MLGKRTALLVIALLILSGPSCSAQPTQTMPAPTLAPTFTPPPARPPATEAEVRRVAPREAKTAFESGAAVLVDVRSPAAFEMSHVAGALSVPLADIEAHPTDLNLDKDQWIITYCT